MKKMIEKYGRANVIITVICCIFFLLNSVLISQADLLNINENTVIAWLLNFLAGCEGFLGKWGSMSYVKCFEEMQLWRLLTYIYLHAGVIHMAMNLAALLMVGKYAERRLGTAMYAAIFHIIAVIDKAVVCLFYTESNSVGASAGIFGMIGIALVMCLKKQLKFRKSEIAYLIIFILISSVLGTETFITHTFALILGIIIGIVLIRNNAQKEN